MAQEIQRKTFKFVKSPKGKLTLGPSLKNLQQRINGRRHFLGLVVLILDTYMVVSVCVCLMYDNPSQLSYY